jgi:hypothetical protein
VAPIQSTPYAGGSPSGIAFAGGNIYVSDFGTGAVTAYTPGTPNASSATPPAGSQTSFALSGSPPVALTAAGGIAIDASGTVYVSDFYNNTVDGYLGNGQYEYAFLPVIALSLSSGSQLTWTIDPYFNSEYGQGTSCTLATTDFSNNVSSVQETATGNLPAATSATIASATLVCPGTTTAYYYVPE